MKNAAWRGFAAGVLVFAVACGAGDGPDLLLLGTGAGVAVLDTDTGAVVSNTRGGVAATGASLVFRAEPRRSATLVSAIDASTGSRRWSTAVSGLFDTAVASSDGQAVALAPQRNGQGGYATGRARTPIVITGPGTTTRTFDLVGNYEPEAFALDRSALFVVQYLPPLAPDRYRVRRLDLRTGRVEGVLTPDGHLQEAMRGFARVSALSPGNDRLYTVYTLDGPAPQRRAFVHVLDLAKLWAHCVELPSSMASSEQSGALAVAPDGSVYVADAESGTLAEIDSRRLIVTRTASVSPPGSGPVRATAAPDDLYLARGPEIVRVDRETRGERARWSVDGEVSVLRPSARGDRLYVGLRDRVLVLHGATGGTLDVLVAELDGIEWIGERATPPTDRRSEIKCAC